MNFISRRLVFWVSSDHAIEWPAGSHVFLFRVLITRARTVGPDRCFGCEQSSEIVFHRLELGKSGPNEVITDPAYRNIVTWNGAFAPTTATTWGQIKALYR